MESFVPCTALAGAVMAMVLVGHSIARVEDSRQATAPKEEQATAPETFYTEIPLRGIFDPLGVAEAESFEAVILPGAVDRALEAAKRLGIRTIVFRIDSPGGLVQCAKDVCTVMERHHASFEYVAVVKRGLSAAIWPAFHCDRIVMLPEATLGAAVVFQAKGSQTDVNEKLNSALASELVASAERRGVPAPVVRAMMTRGASLLAGRSPDGSERRLVSSSADLPDGWEVTTLDTPETILTLTSSEAEQIGLASVCAEADLAQHVGGGTAMHLSGAGFVADHHYRRFFCREWGLDLHDAAEDESRDTPATQARNYYDEILPESGVVLLKNYSFGAGEDGGLLLWKREHFPSAPFTEKLKNRYVRAVKEVIESDPDLHELWNPSVHNPGSDEQRRYLRMQKECLAAWKRLDAARRAIADECGVNLFIAASGPKWWLIPAKTTPGAR